MCEWKKIDSFPNNKKMFIAIAFNVKVSEHSNPTYNSDPYCVWFMDGEFLRWPHKFKPTHWMPIPSPPED